jgi:hypothetical protein
MDFELRALLFKLALPALFVTLFAPLVLYPIAKWRANRDAASGGAASGGAVSGGDASGGNSDPQLGFKLVLYYFGTIAFQLALLGGTVLVYTLIKPSGGEDLDTKSGYYRMSLGLIVPAVLVLGGHVALILRTNDAQQPGVRKLFTALNLVFTGVVGFAALVLGFQALFAKGSTFGIGHLGGAAILVYGTAWGVLGWRYYQLVTGGSDDQTMPDVVLPPPPSQVASGGGLPPLGGGSFPPLDKP